jgi:hypothetical protein
MRFSLNLCGLCGERYRRSRHISQYGGDNLDDRP